MKVIHRLAGWNIKKVDADIGIEIEVEGRNLPRQEDLGKMWRVDTDASLRGESYEYVTPPIKLNELQKYLNRLDEAYAICDSEVTDSIRTGVHVHLNVQQLTLKQLYNLITLYFILEDLLVGWCGPSREGNHFCLRSRDAEFIVFKLVESVRDFRVLDTDIIRYCSLNLYSLFKYGTIEFRSMRGTSDLSAIKDWVEILHSIHNAALTYHDPIDIIMSMSGSGEDSLLRSALPQHHQLFTNIPNYQQLIRDGARRMQILAHATDWSDFDTDEYRAEEIQIDLDDLPINLEFDEEIPE
jgi:hypothetical protein